MSDETLYVLIRTWPDGATGIVSIYRHKENAERDMAQMPRAGGKSYHVEPHNYAD